MRGKVVVHCCVLADLRITPAYAGKSVQQLLHSYNSRDHPRVCGEKTVMPVSSVPVTGSPPRMRGKGVVNVFVSEKLGITPAYAGKS